MEDVLENIGENEIAQLMFCTLVQNSAKLNELRLKLLEDREKCLDDKMKEKLAKCRKLANEKVEAFEKQVKDQLSKVAPVRMYMDGVFDIVHSGHFNAFRQGKALGDVLVCGINSDADVKKVKGKTLMDINERSELADACKWVDEIQKDTPYTPTLDTLDFYKCQYLTHGDDLPTNESGETIYTPMFKSKRIRIFKRTEGISTTVIIGRLLLSLKDKVNALDDKDPEKKKLKADFEKIEKLKSLNRETMNTLITTSKRISEFSSGKSPKPGDKIVYLAGDFDILHKGVIEALKKAKQLGDFVYVGVYDDNTVNKRHGKNYPILNMNERCLNLLSLKYVDEVVFAAQEKITEDFINILGVKVVVRFVTPKMKGEKESDKEKDIYEAARKMGICKDVEVSCELSNEELAERMWKERNQYIKKFVNKIQKKDSSMVESSQGISEQ